MGVVWWRVRRSRGTSNRRGVDLMWCCTREVLCSTRVRLNSPDNIRSCMVYNEFRIQDCLEIRTQKMLQSDSVLPGGIQRDAKNECDSKGPKDSEITRKHADILSIYTPQPSRVNHRITHSMHPSLINNPHAYSQSYARTCLNLVHSLFRSSVLAGVATRLVARETRRPAAPELAVELRDIARDKAS